ncbi:MAG: hypothetical protein ACE5RI_01160 [Candidatus Nitrosomaritimum yanchengensis]
MTKKLTTNKILTTSIVAFAVLALMVPPNIAHATLIGDDVTVTFVGADIGNNATHGGTITNTVGIGSDGFTWVDPGNSCSPPDEFIEVNIEESSIIISLTDNEGVFYVCNGASAVISDPVTFNIESLDWIDFPDAILTGINRTDSDPIATTEQVTGPHSVTITIDADQAFSQETRVFEFDLVKSVVNVEKSWTHTDYNWDQVCDGAIENATGCFLDETTQIDYRPANINTDDVLADPLPLDSNGNYTAYAQVHKNNKFSNTNPGAFYALTTAVTTSSLSSITVLENYTQCTNPDGNDNTDDGLLKFVSKKIDRNVKVAIADSDGNVTEITDFLYDGIDGEIIADLNSTSVVIDHEIPANSTIYVLVKFQDDKKGFDTGDGIFDEMCHNTETVIANIDGDLPGVIAEADLRITNQP